MKFGFRILSLTKRISARFSLKRYVRHSLGVKMPRGVGALTNPKRALYNKIYSKTTIGIDRLGKTKNKRKNNYKTDSAGGLGDWLENNSFLPQSDNLANGRLNYFGLTEWWNSEFSNEEKDHIVKTLPDGESLIRGGISYISGTAIDLLSGLAGWFNNDIDKTIAYRILKKAESMITDSTDIIAVHFFFNSKLKIYYRNRNNDPEALQEAIRACKQQIAIAPRVADAFRKEYKGSVLPRHVGYEQLAIIEEKEKKWGSVISLSKEAMEHGWNGDWDKRIKRCEKKLI